MLAYWDVPALRLRSALVIFTHKYSVGLARVVWAAYTIQFSFIHIIYMITSQFTPDLQS